MANGNHLILTGEGVFYLSMSVIYVRLYVHAYKYALHACICGRLYVHACVYAYMCMHTSTLYMHAYVYALHACMCLRACLILTGEVVLFVHVCVCERKRVDVREREWM